jgi:GTPase SAR1 family protein
VQRQKRERGMAQYDRKYFEKQFEGLPPKAKAVIALRAAMRVLPALTRRPGAGDRPFTYWNKGERVRHALAILRCYEVSLFVNMLTKSDSAAYAAATAATAYAAATATAATADAAYAAAYAATAAAYAAAYAATADADADADAATAATAYAYAYATAAAPTAPAYAAADDAATAAATAATAYAYDATAATAYAALLADIGEIKHLERSWLGRRFGKGTPQEEIAALLVLPLWPQGEPQEVCALRTQLEADLLGLEAGFEIWIEWYRARLEGKEADWEIERQWALLSKEQLAQRPAEINAYLKALRDGSLTKQLKRVRAIFLGHGEVGKTSLIRALHGEEVIEGKEAMTQGVAATDSRYKIDEQAGVFTREQQIGEDDLTVHFWDFGGQVMTHATHQFFLRSKCLYVIVLAGRAERNPNEEAEYWLEHVQAFGDSAPVLLVANKADVMPVNLDQRTLTDKYKNVAGFYSISCTQAKGSFKDEFELFRKKLGVQLKALGEQAERFSEAEFKVLKAIECKADKEDLLSEAGFDEVCVANGIPMEGPSGRDRLLSIFDKLGIVMHFPNLPFLTDFVLNPRWLTYGVYTIMYSDRAKAAHGKLREAELVSILGKTNLTIPNGHALRYPAGKCRHIADAMVAFRVAYRLSTGELVIPALLAPEQPEHDFKSDSALAFRFDFAGFLPRHIVPALIAEYSKDISQFKGDEIVWQNGVLLRPRHNDAEALVRADYHTRNLDLWVTGSDAAVYLGMLRDSILTMLETMPNLPFEEKVELRPEMLVEAIGRVKRDGPVWIAYEIVQAAQRSGDATIMGPGGRYDMRAILAAMPVSPDARQADVFLSYSSKDGPQIQKLAGELEGKRISAWYDAGLIAGQPFREVLRDRIETVKAVVVLWTENSIGSKWVRAEANLADSHGKLICLRDPGLDPKRIPMPFAEAHMIEAGKLPELVEALAPKGAKPKV